MDSARTPKVRFLLPETREEFGESPWVDMRSSFDLKISKLVMPPPPRPPQQIKDPDVLLVELRRKLLAIDRTIKHKDVILEEDEDQEMDFLNKSDMPVTLRLSQNAADEQRQPASSQQPQLNEESSTVQEEPQQTTEKESKDAKHHDQSPNVGSRLPPRPPTKKPQTRESRSCAPEDKIVAKRDDSLPRTFKVRRRSFRDFSKRQFQRALSAMNISHTSSVDSKHLPASTLQNDGKKIRYKSSSSSSLLISNLKSKFQRLPSNFYDKQDRGDAAKNYEKTSLDKKSSWNKLFSSWSTNLQACTRAQSDDD